MKKLHQEIFINAPVKKVWDTMLGDATYREWTKAFHEGSHYRGSWEKGSKILFIGPSDEKGGEEGMVGIIAENRPYEFVSIAYAGLFKNGVEDTTSDEVKKWLPAHENYTFTAQDGGTRLEIDVDVPDEFMKMMEEIWPKALAQLKELAEK